MKNFSRMNPKKKGPSFSLLFIILALVVVGIIVISSASSVISLQTYDDSSYMLKKQIFNVILGLIALAVAYRVDSRIWKKLSAPLLIISLILLVAVLIPGIGSSHGGASRWLNLGPFGSLQPSEVLKFSLVIYLASLFEKKGTEIRTFLHGLLPFSAILVLVAILIMSQPDLGSFLVVAGLSVAVFFVSGSRLKHLGTLVVIGVAGIIALIKFEPYRMQRFLVFLNPEAHATGMGYQINQALLAIGSGGIWGLGFGQSRQKFQYLPEPATDSIFAIIAEEKGLIGALAIIALFAIFGYLGYQVARNANDAYSRLVAVGITSWIIVQAFLNVCAILSLVPLTGVPLPFISYGGSSIIVLLAACGILLNISKNTREVTDENFGSGGRLRRAHLSDHSNCR